MSCIRRRTSFSTWAYIIKMCTFKIRVARIAGRLDDDAEEAKSNQIKCTKCQRCLLDPAPPQLFLLHRSPSRLFCARSLKHVLSKILFDRRTWWRRVVRLKVGRLKIYRSTSMTYGRHDPSAVSRIKCHLVGRLHLYRNNISSGIRLNEQCKCHQKKRYSTSQIGQLHPV